MFLKRMKLYKSDDRIIPALDLKLETSEIAEGKKILSRLVRNDEITICLFTFATGQKCYSEQWWVDFYDRLKLEFPHVNIIEVLPLHKRSQLSSRVITYYSRDIREIGSVLANSVLFVGADSGMMHLASSAQIPTVGLFSVTDKTRYTPYANNSIAIDTNSTNIDECIQIVASVFKNTERLYNRA
jgi:ADP-heptose:LPS heptosyltransferase